MARADADSKLNFAVARDVTVRKQAEDALLHYQETLEQAVAERTTNLRQTTRELEQARLETPRCLALAAEYRDDQTYEHTERVGTTAALLAEKLGLPGVIGSPQRRLRASRFSSCAGLAMPGLCGPVVR